MKTFTDWLKDRGFDPVNLELYREACTHSSYANEHHCPDNERLEFMGDAVLQVWSADHAAGADCLRIHTGPAQPPLRLE